MARFRALIVGAGGMGRAWGHNLNNHPDVDVVGWVDVRPGAAEEACHVVGLTGILASTEFKTSLCQLQPDFVVDVTPPEVHSQITIESLRAGIPVLGEKPMASSMEEARQMVAASDEAGKLYMVSQSRRYDGRLKGYRRLVESLGQLGILNADFYIGAHFGGFRDEMPSPLVLDMAIHTFDAARYLCASDPVAVYAEEFNPAWSWYQGDACASAIFEMANGVRFTYRGSWCAEGLATSWESSWRAVGERGSASWDGYDDIRAEVVRSRGGFHSEMELAFGEAETVPAGIAGSLAEFLEALETGNTPMGECHDNIKSLAMVFGAIESAATARRVEIRI